jgi:hypothetical protein
MQTSSERQELAEQAGAKAVGDQAGELGLEIEELRRGPLRQDLREGTEGFRLVGPAGAMMPSGTLKAEDAEQRLYRDRAGVLVPTSPPTVRAADALGQAAADLLDDHHVLHVGQEILGLLEPEAERLGPKSASLEFGHLVHRRLCHLVPLDHHLHLDPHAGLLARKCSASRWLAARRSKRSSPI